MPACSFPIQRLPDEILSHLFEVGTWFRALDVEEAGGSHRNKNSKRHYYTAPRRHQKPFVKAVSEVCRRWREISGWQGPTQRWYMTVSLNFDGMEGRQSDISRELHIFHASLKASAGCDLEVHLLCNTGFDPYHIIDIYKDDNVDYHSLDMLRLFVHGMRMLFPYLEQVTMLAARLSQSDVVYLLSEMLYGWSSLSRLTWLDIGYGGDLAVSSPVLAPERHDLKYFLHVIQSKISHSLPQTLVDIKFSKIFLPPRLIFPRSLTHLTIKGVDRGARPGLHSWLPYLDCLSHAELDVHGTEPPDLPLQASALFVLRLTTDSTGFPACLQIFEAKNLETLYLTIYESEQRNGRQALSSKLAPAVHRLKRLNIKITLSAVPGAVETSINLEDTLPSEPIVLPQLKTLGIEDYCAYRNQIFEHLPIPYLEEWWFTYSEWPPYVHEKDGALENWISFSSHHRSQSLSRLISLETSLLKFDAAAMCHPFVYVPSIKKLTVCIYTRHQTSGLRWFIYPTPPLLLETPVSRLRHLRHFTVKVLISSTTALENELERELHDIQASRTEHGVGLEVARIEWKDHTVEFLQNRQTGCLEKV